MAARNYSSVARLASLTSGISNSATSMAVDQTTGFPIPPFTLVIDPGRPAEEAVTCTAIVSLTLTIVRGQDGTSAQPHDAAAEIRHMATARDFREPAEHVSGTTGVHGISSEVVGTTDTQVLDNKTFTAAGTDHVPLKVQSAVSQASDAFQVQSPVGSVLGAWKIDGRVSTPGVDSSSTSTFTAGAAATVPLIAKGAASQSARLLSARDSSNAEVASIGPSGAISGASVTSAAGVTATIGTFSGRVATPGVDSSSQSIFSAGSTSTQAVVAVAPTSGTVPTLIVRDQASSTTQAGIGGAADGYRMFHGGDSTNYLPWRMHAGSLVVTISAGNNSTTDIASLTGMGFTLAPVVTATVAGPSGGDAGRVGVVILSRNTTQIQFRTITTHFVNLAADQAYTVYWTAIQMTSSSASG